MMIDDVIKLLGVLATFSSGLAWPLLVLFLVLRFRSPIRIFLENLSELSFKGAGLEASFKRRQLEAATLLAAAGVAAEEGERSVVQAAQDATDVVAEVLTSKAARKVSGSKILWVDDEPVNNEAERDSFESLGMRVSLATSTEQALSALQRKEFDLVISDMGRPPDVRAGYTLLSEMKLRGIEVPFIIYSAGGHQQKHKDEAMRSGAFGSTSRAAELFGMVLRALG